jgi:hypothetical protein
MDNEPVSIIERPTLEAPVLVVMLSGWIDAGGAAAAAMQTIENESAAKTIATFDPDTFIDYRARRPIMELREGVSTKLLWPDTKLKAGRDPMGKDVLLLTGYEPDSNWRLFADTASSLAVELGTSMMVGLGAYPFGAPHTRPPRLSCTTPSETFARSVPFLRNSVDVPAGVAAVLEHAFHEQGVPSIGIWAQVPHYIATMTYPAASAALLTGLKEVSGLAFEGHSFRHEAAIQRQRLDQLVDANPDHVEMLRQLERAYDAMEAQTIDVAPNPPALDADQLPSGEDLAAEFERFLREQGE